MLLFPSKWPVVYPNRIQLYSAATPNGEKVGIMLEETGLPYEAHLVDIHKGDQLENEFLHLNPNGKIPVIIDPDGPKGQPIRFMESVAILMYLAEKSGRFMPKDPALKWESLQWLYFQTGHVAPTFDQFGHFYTAGAKAKDEYAIDRYASETRRLLKILDRRMADREWIMGDEFSVADIAIVPWIKELDAYGADQLLGMEQFYFLNTWRDRFYSRPGVVRGSHVCQPLTELPQLRAAVG